MLTLTQIVGNKVRLLRDETGKSQDEVAAAARACGLGWGRSTIAQLEGGTKRLSAEELVLLPLLFLRAFDSDWDVPSILTPMDTDGKDDMVRLTDEASVSWQAVRSALTGDEEVRLTQARGTPAVSTPATREWAQSQEEAVARARQLRDAFGIRGRFGPILRAIASAGEAEQKAARKLGVPADYVAVAAFVRWGRTLTEERDRVVASIDDDPAGQSARRGHVTRALLAELEPIIRKAG